MSSLSTQTRKHLPLREKPCRNHYQTQTHDKQTQQKQGGSPVTLRFSQQQLSAKRSSTIMQRVVEAWRLRGGFGSLAFTLSSSASTSPAACAWRSSAPWSWQWSRQRSIPWRPQLSQRATTASSPPARNHTERQERSSVSFPLRSPSPPLLLMLKARWGSSSMCRTDRDQG